MSSFVLFAQIPVVVVICVFVVALLSWDTPSMIERATPWRRMFRRLGGRHLTLTSEFLVLQLAIILAALIVGLVSSWLVARARVDDEYGHRALAIAQSVASFPTVIGALNGTAPTGPVEQVAESVRHASGATFVVVMNREGVRLSHPNPALIGKPVSDSGPALDGKPWIGSDNGSLGASIRAKAPVFDSGGHVIGVVSVGFREDIVLGGLLSELPAIGATFGSALALATAGSFLLARRVKRKTFGLEPEEIGAVLEQREAILHGIREGTIATDLRGRISLVNDEARDLLGLDEACIGRSIHDVLRPGRIREMLSGESGGKDEVVINGDRVLIANRMPVAARGGVIGYVVTLRDRTELVGALRELDEVRDLSDALRAHAHEFSNRLHTLAGLIEMGRHDEALAMITEERTVQQELAESVARRIENPVLSALVLSRSVVAAERGIDFRLSEDTHASAGLGDNRELVTIVGNLVDNAFDAVAQLPPGRERRVDLSIRADDSGIAIEVRDSGPGIDSNLGTAIFDKGVTSKSTDGSARGLGLALVRHAVERRGGVIDFVNDGGAVFRVRLPAFVQSLEAAVTAGE
jgi:two-component system, CitB family, sensor kinase